MEHKPEVCDKRMEILEERVRELRARVESFDGLKEVLIELKILTSQQIKANEQRDEIVREQGIALTKAVETLSTLSKKQDSNEEVLDELNKKISQKESNDYISVSGAIKKGFLVVFTIIITAIISLVLK